MENIVALNKLLADRYGKLPDGRPIFRITWSEGQLEKRWGIFNDYYPGTNIFLREFKGVREVKKYSWIKERWILEKLIILPRKQFELPSIIGGENGTYEPIWVFWYKDGSYQKPTWNTVEFLVHGLLYGKAPSIPNQGSMDDIEKAEKLAEIREFEEMLDIRTPLQSALHDGDAISVPSNYSIVK